MEGILYKQGEGLVKSWKKRWCFLNREEAKLYYGKDRGAGFISAIALDKALSVTRSERIKAKGVGFGFQIATSDRIWSLVALTNTERESWIKAIQRLILSSEKVFKKNQNFFFSKNRSLKFFILRVQFLRHLHDLLSKARVLLFYLIWN
eukprot:TRINITY_DN4972_c0_g1_i2.p1 TRINITY_DN4972_c0_g1~~TRINITY_DN4972_c0_g1_i2.p1  ORF type:complete len:165 (+),score=15.21 TRINITY_DN4972_c0_g1_i2:50-496(+)